MKKTTSTPQWVLLCDWILLIQPVIAQVNSLSTRVFDLKSVQPNTVIVDVRTPAEWCGPCKMMKPILENLHQRMGNKVRILKVDIDKSPAIASALQIQSVPTLLLFKAGQPVWRQSGVLQAAELEKIITPHTV